MDQVILNRYLADQLTDFERSELEARLAASPALLEQLEATARLKVGLAVLKERGELDAALSPKPWRSARLVALVASVAALAIGIAIWRAPVGTSPLAASLEDLAVEGMPEPAVIARFVVLRTRTNDYDAHITRPASPGALELRVMPSFPPAPDVRYRVDLTRIDQGADLAPVASLGLLSLSEQGWIRLFAASDALTPGTYRMTLTPAPPYNTTTDEEIFLLRVR